MLFYFNTLYNGYSLDDEMVTGPSNAITQDLSSIKKIFTDWYDSNVETGAGYEYRPLVKLSFALENQLFGLKPGIHHFFNLIFYFLCCILLFRFLLKLFNGRYGFSLLVTLLFAAHPIHTEVVASLKNRDILLVFILSFCAGLLLLDQFEKKKLHPLKLLLVLALFYLATLSKRDALIFAFIFPLLIWLRYSPRFYMVALSGLLIAGCYVLMVVMRKALLEEGSDHHAMQLFENPLYGAHSAADNILAAVNCVGFYMVQNFFPVKQACYYGYDQIQLSAATAYFFIGIIALAGGGFLFFRTFKKDLPVQHALIFLFGGMVLYLNILRPVPGITGDRFAFVSSIGACILLPLAIEKILKADFRELNGLKYLSSPAKIIFAVLLSAYLFVVFKRNPEWRDKETLFAADVTKAPRSAKLHSLYALELLAKYRELRTTDSLAALQVAQTAINELRTSLDIYPDYVNSQSNLAYLLVATRQQPQEAKLLLEKAMEARKGKPEIIFNYANLLSSLGEHEKAERYYLECLSLKKEMPEVYSMLPATAEKTQHFTTVADAMKNALPASLKTEAMFTTIGNLYARGKDTLNAVRYYDSAVTVRPFNQNMGRFLYGYYESHGMPEKAERIRKLFGK